jgi:hypothetical protein
MIPASLGAYGLSFYCFHFLPKIFKSMRNLIIIGAHMALLAATLTSCEKAEMAPDGASKTRTTTSSSSVSDQRNRRTLDTEDRPKMVKGHIQNSAQADIPDASVAIYLVSDSSKILTVYTDSNGDFEMDSIYGGNYYLMANASGYLNTYKGACIPVWPGHLV